MLDAQLADNTQHMQRFKPLLDAQIASFRHPLPPDAPERRIHRRFASVRRLVIGIGIGDPGHR